MHPILFELGPVVIPTYGSILVITFLVCAFLLKREAQRCGLPPQKMIDLAVITLLCGLIGAKLLLVIVDFPQYWENPRLLLSTIRAAGVLYGGMIGGIIAASWYVRRHQLPVIRVLDLFSPFLALGIGLGRLGCLTAGCCFGVPYAGPLAVHFPSHPYCEAPTEVGLFPIQLVSSINGVVLFLVLLGILRRSKHQGTTVMAFFALYALTRTGLEFFRGDMVRGVFFGFLSTSQIISILVLLAVGTIYIWTLRKRKKKRV